MSVNCTTRFSGRFDFNSFCPSLDFIFWVDSLYDKIGMPIEVFIVRQSPNCVE